MDDPEVDITPLPSSFFISRMLQWLYQLMETYRAEENKIPSENSHRRLLVRLILDTCVEAAYNAKKTELAIQQYNLLTDKLYGFRNKRSEGKHNGPELYSSAWNRQQVYSGVREMYTEFLWKCSEVMLSSCRTLKTLNEQYLRHYS